MAIVRRRFLIGSTGLALVGPAVRSVPAQAQAAAGPFEHGVASGDPLPDAVIIWTRVTTDTEQVPVRWLLAEDEGLTRVVADGEVATGPESDHTVKVDVTGLEPATTYHYGFETGAGRSSVGRTRTAPVGAADRLRIGVASCGRWATGHFNAYGRLAAREVDVVLHLGDYIYEDGGAAVRAHDPPHQLLTLSDYRRRYAQHRTDPDLQELHRRHPTVHIWDDHELAENAWRRGARDHDETTDGPWATRLAAAAQAWREWLPVRMPDPGDQLRIWRRLPYGDLADLYMLDTRIHGRDQPVPPDAVGDALRDPTRRLLGDAQATWLTEQLRASKTTWRIIGNQVVFAALVFPAPVQAIAEALRERGFVVEGIEAFNPDQWDGYAAERGRVLDAIDAAGLRNVVVTSGDIHSSMVSGVTPGVTELVTPSVTSANFDELLDSSAGAELVQSALRGANPNLRYAELQSHGYVVLDLTPERLQADWWFVDTITERSAAEHHGTSWVIQAIDERVEETRTPSTDLDRPSAPPEDPDDDDDRTLLTIGGAGAVAAAAGALLALRRRRHGDSA